MSDDLRNYWYKNLGVRPVINAGGNTTLWGGSTSSIKVRQAMEESSDNYVEMDELMQNSGHYIATMLGVENAYVTSGCAAAMILSAAACMAGVDPKKTASLPSTTGMKNEIVFQKQQQYPYQRMFSVPGSELVLVGDDKQCTVDQLYDAINPNTAAVAYVYHSELYQSNLTIEEVVRVAHSKDVPVIVDAAGQVYPLDRFTRIAQAADLVCFGAKYFGAPHSTGVVCGRGDLIQSVAAQGFIGFETGGRRSLGRGYKVDRQEIVGEVAAMDEWFSLDHEERILDYGAKLNIIQRSLDLIPKVFTEIRRYDSHYQIGLHISFDNSDVDNIHSLSGSLLEGNPRIRVRVDDDNTIAIIPHTLNHGEESIIASRLTDILS